MKAAKIELLVDEFRATGFGRTEVEARRAAFTAIAWSEGWSTARIGRYLGVSRARVGQRIAKLQIWATDPDMPILRRTMSRDRTGEPAWLADMPVAFLAADWQKEEFSGGMLNLLASDRRAA